MVDQRALAQQHAFRSPRRAGAVDHQRSFALVDLGVAVHGRRRGKHGFVLVAHHHDAFHRRHSFGGRRGGRPQLGSDEEQPRAAVVEHVDEFVADDAPVDEGRHGPDRRGGEKHLEAGGVVLVQNCHALSTLHTGGAQRTGGATDPCGPVSPGPLPFPVSNRDGVGPLLCMPVDESGERLRRRRRAVGWSHNPSE